ncbi:MAG: hypothetical protein ACUVV0_11905 [Anaerolineae bacterium]
MEAIFVDKAKLTLDELIERVKKSNKPLYLGSSGRAEVIVSPIKRELEPEQQAAIDALEDLLHKLRSLEEKYQMDSAEFFYRYENGLLEETPDYVSWWVTYSAFAEALQRYNLTRSEVECQLMEGSETITGSYTPS